MFVHIIYLFTSLSPFVYYVEYIWLVRKILSLNLLFYLSLNKIWLGIRSYILHI